MPILTEALLRCVWAPGKLEPCVLYQGHARALLLSVRLTSGVGGSCGARRGKGPCCPWTWGPTWTWAQGMRGSAPELMGTETCPAVVFCAGKRQVQESGRRGWLVRKMIRLQTGCVCTLTHQRRSSYGKSNPRRVTLSRDLDTPVRRTKDILGLTCSKSLTPSPGRLPGGV